MSLVKRGKTWHTHFFVDGQRFRQSLDTTDWREAQAREKALIAKASQGKLAPVSQQFSRLRLDDAIDRYLADRSARVTTRSHRSESDHAKPLRETLGSTPVNRITVEAILGYIRERKAQGVSNTTVNMETGILRRVLKRAKRWHYVADEVPHLRERKDVGRALALDEKLRLLRIAAARPEWESAVIRVPRLRTGYKFSLAQYSLTDFGSDECGQCIPGGWDTERSTLGGHFRLAGDSSAIPKLSHSSCMGLTAFSEVG